MQQALDWSARRPDEWLGTLLAWGLLAAGFLTGTVGDRLWADASRPIGFLIFLIPTVLYVVVHAVAQSVTALFCGDHTAMERGRLSLDPRKQFDALGLAVLLVSYRGLGYGQPVPVDEQRLRRPSDLALIAFAGPLATLALAAIAAVPLRFAVPNTAVFPFSDFLRECVGLGCVYTVFHLLPLPPLDGATVVASLLDEKRRMAWRRMRAIGPVLIVSLLVLAPQLTEAVVYEPARSLVRFLLAFPAS